MISDEISLGGCILRNLLLTENHSQRQKIIFAEQIT